MFALTNKIIFHKIILMKYSALKIVELVLVNLITTTRLLGAFALPFIYIYYGPSICAIVTIILFLTDAVDGFLARTLKISTFLGSMLDAFSDKLLNGVSFVILGIEYSIMFAPLILELSILYTNYSTYRFGGNVQSSIIGKIKTVILDIFVILSFVLLSLNAFNVNNKIIKYLVKNTNTYINIFGCIITIVCIIALLDYMKKNKKTRSNPKFTHVKFQNRKRKTFKEVMNDLVNTKYYIKHKNEAIMKQFYK